MNAAYEHFIREWHGPVTAGRELERRLDYFYKLGDKRMIKQYTEWKEQYDKQYGTQSSR